MNDRKLEEQDVKKLRIEIEKSRAGKQDKFEGLSEKEKKKLRKEMDEARKNTR